MNRLSKILLAAMALLLIPVLAEAHDRWWDLNRRSHIYDGRETRETVRARDVREPGEARDNYNPNQKGQVSSKVVDLQRQQQDRIEAEKRGEIAPR